MILAHIRASFRATFEARMSEWALSISIVLWGLIVLNEPGRFADSRAYSDFLHLMPQNAWGLGAFLIGSLRLIVLFFNGLLRRSPHLRAFTAFLSCFLWIQISLGLFAADGFTGLAMYPVALGMDIFNVLRAAREAGMIDTRVAKNGTHT